MDDVKEYVLGDLIVRYVWRNGGVELELIPDSKKEAVIPNRKRVSGTAVNHLLQKIPARFPCDSLLQIKLRGEPTGPVFSEGITSFDSLSTQALEFISQEVVEIGDAMDIQTVLRHPKGLRCVHHAVYRKGLPVLRVYSEVINESSDPVVLELLSSFALSGITPFSADDAPERLKIHRFRSWWCAEGKLETRSIEDLHLERTWLSIGVRSERFGQVGFMPVRRFFPFVAVEDTEADVLWGAKLAWAGSWQMEVLRRGDALVLSGGLADREFGHWSKTLAPGETLISPEAMLACTDRDLDDLCRRFLKTEEASLPIIGNEESMPVIFNEWCSSWGSPTEENVLAAADRLKQLPINYFVIDDGWAERPPEASSQSNGDWVVDSEKFPNGLKAVADGLRERGFVPGIWFEFEVCNPGSKAWNEAEHHLHRDGAVLETATRRYWNFRDPWVQDYLSERLIGLLRDNGIGYLKVDYNDTIGIGCDHPDSLGEGLRLQVLAVQDFFRKLRREVPGLVIENCSSGGHRLEPSMMQLVSMGSFSDAHEGEEIPIIAANLQRLILPRQSQIWAVLRKEDSIQRMIWSLTAGCLGRLCISGDIGTLSDEQFQTLEKGLKFYEAVAPIIRDGESEFFGRCSSNWLHPKGWQAVVRRSVDEKTVLIVAHSFAVDGVLPVELPLPVGRWTVTEKLLHAQTNLLVQDGLARFELPGSWVGQAWLLQKDA